jgi:hypothetical protein
MIEGVYRSQDALIAELNVAINLVADAGIGKAPL